MLVDQKDDIIGTNSGEDLFLKIYRHDISVGAT